jgi:hypothetical protein
MTNRGSTGKQVFDPTLNSHCIRVGNGWPQVNSVYQRPVRIPMTNEFRHPSEQKYTTTPDSGDLPVVKLAVIL